MRSIVLVAAALFAGCLADTEPTGDAVEPGLSWGTSSPDHATPAEAGPFWRSQHGGPCADACYEVWRGACSWRDGCDTDPYDEVTCAGKALTCRETAEAATSVAGLSWCFRSCEGLH